ncbi:hypothetical protein [Megasphaera sp.]|uniref:RNA polymerase sigma factor n=1 Tax=Megasphaera sp. TaxID=2023260 RepID=UPI0025BD9A40|nr:hypothetical protein [Megasphaera sp.]
MHKAESTADDCTLLIMHPPCFSMPIWAVRKLALMLYQCQLFVSAVLLGRNGDKMYKKQTSNEKRFYIPLELTSETVITEAYKDCEVHWSKIGCRKVRTILIPATEEQYREYMRPLWREDKRQQRHGADEVSADKVRDDYELEVPDDFNLEEEVVKKELLAALRHELAALQDIDRTILLMIADGASEAATGKAVGLSQKAVNKRKHKLYALLKEHLKDFR